MHTSTQQRRAERLNRLRDEVGDLLLAQVTGPFGLAPLRMKDLNGGNVTTVHNFSRADADYVATADDRARHAHAHGEYQRAEYEVKTQKAAQAAGCATYGELRKSKVAQGKNEYTGNAVGDKPQLDHVTSLKALHQNKGAQLGMTTVDASGQVGVQQIAGMAHHEANLKLTDGSANASKGSRELGEWAAQKGDQHGLDPAVVAAAKQQSDSHVSSTVAGSLALKQGKEVALTGLDQGARMALRQAVGILFSELVKRLIHEGPRCLRAGIQWTKAHLKSIGRRLMAAARSVARAVAGKLKTAVLAGLEGGLSGFVSNLVTFLINNVVSTAKRFVTVIREGLSGLVKAAHTIFFPEEGMTAQQALQAGLQILSATLTATCGILMTEAVQQFISSVPLLAPIADLLSGVLVGSLTGLLTAFLAYRIDVMFDSSDAQHRERVLDQLNGDATRQQGFVDTLAGHVRDALAGVESYMASIALYQSIGAGLGRLGQQRAIQLAGLRAQSAEIDHLREQTRHRVDELNASRARMAAFLGRSA